MKRHKIKILSPIDKLSEAMPLIRAGADEFYCGVLVDDVEYSCHRLKNKYRSNVRSLKELEKITKITREHGKEVFVAFNSPYSGGYFKKGLRKNVLRNIERIRKAGASGLIIASFDLLDLLKDCGLDIIISSLLSVKNPEAVRFIAENFQIRRVILDRQITLKDIRSIVSEFPQIEFETFVMEAACRNIDALCRHRLAARKGIRSHHLCPHPFSIERKSKKNKDLEIIARRLTLPSRSCGACALWQFKKHGIHSVKIVGRSHSSQNKIQNTKFVRSTLDLLKVSKTDNEFYKEVRRLFKEIFGLSCLKQYCYYPHF